MCDKVVYNKACRACLINYGRMKSIHYVVDGLDLRLTFSDLLTNCTSVEVIKGDGLPEQICIKCIRQLRQFYKFKQVVQRSDETLRNDRLDLAASIGVKLEDDVCNTQEDIEESEVNVHGNTSSGSDSETALGVEHVIHEVKSNETCKDAPIEDKLPIPPLILLVVSSNTSTDSSNDNNKVETVSKSSNKVRRSNKLPVTDIAKDNNVEEITVTESKVETLIVRSDTLNNIDITESVSQAEADTIEKQQKKVFSVGNDHAYTKKRVYENEDTLSKSYYYCKWCLAVFTDLEEYEKHVPEKHGSIFECEHCHSAFKTQDELANHKSCHNSNRGCEVSTELEDVQKDSRKPRKRRPATCTICNKVCKTSWQLSTHMLSHTGERPHMCHICGKRFAQKPHLKTHHYTHSGVKNFVCEVCGKKFATVTFLKTHLRQHSRTKKHKCDQCLKMFSLPCELKAHVRTHTGERPFKCTICNKSFCSKSALKTHTSKHTEDVNDDTERPFSCDKCDKAFTKEIYLENHIAGHSKENDSFICDVCGRDFRTKANLKMHSIRHTASRPYSCHKCGRSFREENLLISHLKFHMLAKPFECETCHKKFIDRSALRVHNRIHTGEKPFVCTVCDKRFTVKRSLQSHMRCHTGERPFRCSVCNNTFTQRCSLQTHMLLLHKRDP